jgi:hypothetical protein
MRSTYLAFGG